MKLFKSQSGDTIVEVLIALVIVSTVMIGAFLTTTSTQNSVQDNQEHTQASQIAQTQLEFLHKNAELDTAVNSCFGLDGAPVAASNTNGCKVAASGNAACSASDQYCYNIKINRVPLAGDDQRFTYDVIVTWDRLGGGNNEVSLNYRPNVVEQVSFNVDTPLNAEATIDKNSQGNGGGIGANCQKNCGENGHPVYIRNFTIVDYTDNLKVTNCTWQWGDGTSQTFSASAKECSIGQRVTHEFPPHPSYPKTTTCIIGVTSMTPYIKKYNVVLSLTTNSGQIIQSQRSTVGVPYCG